MPQASMVVNSSPVPPTAAARYRKSLLVNELNDLNCFTVLLSICILTGLLKKTLGDLLTHSSYLANGVPPSSQKINIFRLTGFIADNWINDIKQCSYFIHVKKKHCTFTMQCTLAVAQISRPG
jgi:hypothetical protein